MLALLRNATQPDLFEPSCEHRCPVCGNLWRHGVDSRRDYEECQDEADVNRTGANSHVPVCYDCIRNNLCPNPDCPAPWPLQALEEVRDNETVTVCGACRTIL